MHFQHVLYEYGSHRLRIALRNAIWRRFLGTRTDDDDSELPGIELNNSGTTRESQALRKVGVLLHKSV